jgi:hypothetical protein
MTSNKDLSDRFRDIDEFQLDNSRKLSGYQWFLDAVNFYITQIKNVINLLVVPCRSRLYVFGDSHSQVLPSRRGLIKISVGPITLHRAGKEGETESLARSAFSWPRKLRRLPYPEPCQDSTLIVSFGEIDFRVHVAKESVRQNSTPEAIIGGLLESALSVVRQLKNLYGCKIIFMGVIPPTNQHMDARFPISGRIEQRIAWVATFNQELDSRLKSSPELRARVLDVSSDFKNEDGSLNSKFSDGTVHYGRIAGGRFLKSALDLAELID